MPAPLLAAIVVWAVTVIGEIGVAAGVLLRGGRRRPAAWLLAAALGQPVVPLAIWVAAVLLPGSPGGWDTFDTAISLLLIGAWTLTVLSLLSIALTAGLLADRWGR